MRLSSEKKDDEDDDAMMHFPLGRGDGSEGARAIPNMLKNSALFTENGALSVRPTE